MTETALRDVRIRNGVWEGLLRLAPGHPTPVIEVTHLDQPVSGVSVVPLPDEPGSFAVLVPIPVEMLREGAHTFLLRLAGKDEALGHFSVLTGIGVSGDLRQEVDLLRAELDLLKRAFRRHVQQSHNLQPADG